MHRMGPSQVGFGRGFVVAAFLGIMIHGLGGSGVAHAHPLSQGTLDVTVHPDRVDVRARVTMEEVAVTDMLTAAASGDAVTPGPGPTSQIFERHARYLAAHLHVTADGKLLVGRVVRTAQDAIPSATRPAAAPLPSPDEEHVIYELEYRPAGGQAMDGPPTRVELRQDVLVGVELVPGVTWEASYVVNIGPPDGQRAEGLLLTSAAPLVYDGHAPAGGTWRLLRDYASHGVHHILSGYDHLLFIGALVLAAVSLWDLVKVVSAFTLAHTITLLLSALDVVRLPEWIVEPMIAASIVFVAGQNVLWPKQSRGWVRLAAAFFFGLFHGLGYAGGLLEAMEGMSGRTVLLAILAFSVGVELGHQVVVLPLFGLLKLTRRAMVADGNVHSLAHDRVSILTLRYGSALICVAGVYYFVAAVGAGLTATPGT